MANYFKFVEDPHELLVWLLEVSGQLKTEEFSLMNRVMTLMGAVFTINACLGPLFAGITSTDASLQERGEMFLYATSGFYISTKFFNCCFRRNQVRSVLRIMKSLWQMNEDRTAIKEKCDKRCRSAMKNLFSILNSLVLLMIVKGIVTNIGKTRDERKLPFPCWLPLDQREWFVTHCMWETLTMALEMFNVSVHYSFLSSTIIQASAHMDILSSNLQAKSVDIKRAIKLHIEIIRLVTYLNIIHGAQMALEIFMYGLQVAAAGYYMMKLLQSGGEFGSLVFSFYVLFLYISFSYLLCLGGHEITLQSEKVFVSIYQSQWYELSLVEQKELSIMLCMAARDLKISYKGLVVFSMERYAQMIQAAYTYLTVLSGMEL